MKSLFWVVTVSLLFHIIIVIQQQEPITPRVVLATQHFTTEPFIFRSIFPQIKAIVKLLLRATCPQWPSIFLPEETYVYTPVLISLQWPIIIYYLPSDSGIAGFPNSSQQKMQAQTW